MDQIFPVKSSGNSLKWAILIALLIDVPFLLITLFSSSYVKIAILFMMILPVGISALIIYASYSSGKMKYILGEDELRIHFPLSPFSVNYNKIKYADKVETNLRFRLFGGSLPGSYWGLFTTNNLGKVQVYASMYSGGFVLLELYDNMKILLSPHDPDAFLEALNMKTHLMTTSLTPVAEPSQDPRLVYSQLVVVLAAWLILLYYVASIYPSLPDIIPVHFGLNGIPNRYGNKIELYYLVGVAAIFPSLNTVFVFKFGKYNKSMTMFLSVVFSLAIGLFFLIVKQIVNSI